MVKRILALSLCLFLIFSLAGCAVTKANPNLNPQMSWQINTANLLLTLQGQYEQFYTDVGAAQKAGTLTAAQVADYNVPGVAWKTTLETANQLFKQYESTHDEALKVQIVGLISKAEQIAFNLTSQFATAKGGKQ